jgi:redox-sensitive bicupin YhaK (pirin superfamily)
MRKSGKEIDITQSSNDTSGAERRSIKLVTKSNETSEGDGFIVHRCFPSQSIRNLDPFLLLDEMGPLDLLPYETKVFRNIPIEAL